MGDVFADSAVPPDRESIRVVLGDAGGAWDAVVDVFAEVGAEVSWHHYRDGGWLAKAVRGKRTLAWLSVEPGIVRVAFHFAQRLRARLPGSDVLEAQMRGRVVVLDGSERLFTVQCEISDEDASPVEELARLKLTVK